MKNGSSGNGSGIRGISQDALSALAAVGVVDAESVTKFVDTLPPELAAAFSGNGNGGGNGAAHPGDGRPGAVAVAPPNGNGGGNGATERRYEPARLSDNARVILEKRYLMKDSDGNPIEDGEGMFRRVAEAVAQGELTPDDQAAWADRFYGIMASLKFLPNSPTLVNAGGNGRGCLSACFVVSPRDDMNSIMEVASDAAMIEKWGGGIGFGFSKLRPKRDRIATTHGEACGPIAVMKLYSSVGATLTQGSFRLGAHMGQLHINHPDIQDFIHCKDGDDTLQNFNISVQITDAFMQAVADDADWHLYNPRDAGDGPVNEITRTVRARDLWREICESAWKTGDPGVVFMDRVLETQPNPQLGDIQTSNPCGEEFLENYGNCCLGSINLDKHIGVGGFDWDVLEDTVRTAARFLDNVIEVNQFPLQKLRDVNLATRRIGLGVMGWADALIRLGVPYDSERALALTDEVAKFIHDIAWNESERLAAERGPFPEYENSALKARGMPPARNSSVVTIAPTGTISRIADCSSGIEPHFANAWWSNVLWTDQDGASHRLLDAPKSVWEELRNRLGDEGKVRGALESLADAPDAADRVFTDCGMDPARFRTAMQIGADAHVRMQAAWQKWVTNSVSKTINLPNDASVDDVEAAYMLAWRTNCKAVTVYRDGSKSMQVLETGKDAAAGGDADAALDNGAMTPRRPRRRPQTMYGVTECIKTAHGTMYVTLNFDESHKPFELFTQIGKAGGVEMAHLEGLARMVSLCLRSGIDSDAIINQLSGITSEPVWDRGVLIRSAEDGVAHVLKQHLQGPGGPGAVNIGSGGSAQLGLFAPGNGGQRGNGSGGNGYGAADYAAQGGNGNSYGAADYAARGGYAANSGAGNGNGYGADANNAAGYVAEGGASYGYAVGAAVNGACPKCEGRVVHQEGCARCLECGYTKCE